MAETIGYGTTLGGGNVRSLRVDEERKSQQWHDTHESGVLE